jgi:hypothetical protein
MTALCHCIGTQKGQEGTIKGPIHEIIQTQVLVSIPNLCTTRIDRLNIVQIHTMVDSPMVRKGLRAQV